MDATYRSDLRELNEQNFARFEAKLDQRLAELKAELRSDFATKAESRAEIAKLATTEELRTELAGMRAEMQSHKARRRR